MTGAVTDGERTDDASRFAGMGPFGLIWAGHVVSLVGNSVLRFGLIVQVWTDGGRATGVVLLSLCALVPQIVLSPTAGALVDRMNRRTALQVADAGGLLAVGALCAGYFLSGAHPVEVYLTVACVGAAAAFQYPALSAAVPALVHRNQLQRANGLLASAKNSAEVGGPALGGLLVALSGLGAILWIDLASFVLALATVRVARFAEPVHTGPAAAARPRRRLLAESVEGLRELWGRPGLRDLVIVDFLANLVMVLGFAVLQPMVLARTHDDVSVLAAVNMSIGAGSVAGGVLLAFWGGPRNRTRGMMLGIAGMCLTSQLAMSAADGAVGWCAAVFLGALLMPIVNGAMQSVMQTKVPPEVQGRVFGAVMFVSQLSVPVSMAVSGPLADHVFEPQAAAGRGLVHLLAPVVGEGRGSGMAAMLLIAGVCGLGAALWGQSRRAVRDLDLLVPDLVRDPSLPHTTSHAKERKS